MTVEHHSGRQQPLHCSEWQKDEFFFQLLPRLYVCPLLQRQTQRQQMSALLQPLPPEKYPEKRSLAAIVWSKGLFPASTLVVVEIVTSSRFLKAESLGAVVLKWEQDHLPPLVCDLLRRNLWFLIQNRFIVSKVLSPWIEKNSLLCALHVHILILFLFLCISEVLLYCHLLFCVTVLAL